MLMIRDDQLSVFTDAAERAFERRLEVHLLRHFPEPLRRMDRPSRLAFIQGGVERGRAYGLTSERDLCKFLNLEATFGPDFANRPDFTWVRAYLGDPEVPNPTERLHRLYAEVLKRLDRAARRAEPSPAKRDRTKHGRTARERRTKGRG